ncbi:MAG: COX15/CtaA family protein [Gammaproteobacteria bacterium]
MSDAGLGCPDWPGCYGQLIVPDHEQEILSVDEAYPDRPLEHGKAWKEMIHRYAAGTLGLVILALAILAVKNRKQSGQAVILPIALLFLVIFQALLGMWTVTLLLKPVFVMGHLLGGMAILSLLYWLLIRQTGDSKNPGQGHKQLFPWVVAGLFVLLIQISLGGWTSANYAAMVCPDFPTCQGKWWPQMDFTEGFTLWRGLGVDYEGGVLAGDARTAIHLSHRLGALLTLSVVGAVAIRAIRDKNQVISRTGIVLLLVLLTQIGLGITNIVRLLPLPVAVAHNGVAAILLLCLVTLLHHAVPRHINSGESIG